MLKYSKTAECYVKPQSCRLVTRCMQGQTRRVVVFVVGGITRSEIRVAHKLSARLGRDIILGGTSADIPSTFVKGLAVSPLATGAPMQGVTGLQKMAGSPYF